MFVRLSRCQHGNDATEHLLTEVFGSVEDPQTIDANLTPDEAQATLDGFELAK